MITTYHPSTGPVIASDQWGSDCWCPRLAHVYSLHTATPFELYGTTGDREVISFDYEKTSFTKEIIS